jgi:hypothetical protein
VKNLYAVVYLHGNRYRLAGVSHDDGGSRLYYESLEEMENAFRSRLDLCERMEERPEGAQACWHCAKGEEHMRIEAHQAEAVTT